MTERTLVLPPAQQELKAAFAALRRAFGGQQEASAATGYRQQEISDWERPNVAQFPRLDAIAALEAMTVGLPGHPHITRLLARRAGFVLVPVPQAAASADGVMRALARIQCELGDVSRAAGEASEDGAVSGADARAVLRELDEMDACSAALRMLLAPLAGGETAR